MVFNFLITSSYAYRKQCLVDVHRVRMYTFSPQALSLLLLLSSALVNSAHYQYGDGVEAEQEDPAPKREGKIFSRRFWDGFERGIKDTANIFSRVSDNLEVAFDQMASDFSDNLSTFADNIERRVGESFTPYGREGQEENLDDPLDLEAVGGSIGGGIDDGLEVYYPKVKGSQDPEEPVEGVQINPLLFPKPDESGAPDGGFKFGVDIFNPFESLGGNSGLFNIFRRKKPWWQGNNVCVDREEIDDTESNTEERVESEVETTTNSTKDSNEEAFQFFTKFQMSSCRDSRDKYTCINSSTRRGLHKTIKVTYRCCHGFVRDGYGCTKIDIFPIPETLEKLGTTSDFLSLIKAADLIDVLSSSNLTIFAPSNEAIAEYTADLEDRNEMENNIDGLRNDVYRRRRETHNLAPTLLSHMTNNFVYAGDFTDEMIIPSLNEKSTLRLNMYTGYPPTVTVNCARIVTANQHSINGVIHTIDRVIKPVEKSIADIIASDSQFTIMKQLLSSSGMVEDLRADGQFTIFAPTDAAFKKLKPTILNSLLEGSTCLQAVIKQHILPNTICSASIQGKMKTSSLLDQYLIVERTEDDKLFVEDSQIVAKDIVGTNGVLHIIDKPLIPNEAKSISEILEYHNLTNFMELLELAELMDEFDTKKDITIFAPTNSAIEKIPENEMTALKNDPEKLREILRYHMTLPSIRANTLANNQMAKTAAGPPLRINLYAGAPLLTGIFRGNRGRPVRVTAGCSRVSVLDSRACGAVVHIIEDMLEVPKADILSALEEEKFSLFRRMIEDTGIRKELKEEGPYTLLVPSDHALRTLPEEELEDIMKNNELKEKIVRKHILKEHICCSGVNPNNWLFMDRKRTMDGSNIHIRRAHNGRLMAGPARIIDCGSPTSNGVVHTINRMIVDESDLVPSGGRNGPGGMRILPLSNFGKLFVF